VRLTRSRSRERRRSSARRPGSPPSPPVILLTRGSTTTMREARASVGSLFSFLLRPVPPLILPAGVHPPPRATAT
jgi:hypothetical protein